MILVRKFLRIVIAFSALAAVAQAASAAAPCYLVVDSQTGYVLVEQGARDKRQIGSLTKIATACVVLDWAEKKGGDLNQTATIPPEAFIGIEKNEIGFQPGDTLTLRDNLQGTCDSHLQPKPVVFVTGGPGNDRIRGSALSEKLLGGPGNDIISAGPCDADELDGGPGNDKLTGGPNDDILRGNAGNDRLFGGRGDDQLFGGPGRDKLVGGPGRDLTRQ